MLSPKLRSLSTLSLAGIVLLVGGLGIAIFASQQSTEHRSRADYDPADPKVGDFVGSGQLQTTNGNTTNPGSPGAPAVLPTKPGVTYKIVLSGTFKYQNTRTTGDSAGVMTDAEWDDWQQSGNNSCYCRFIGVSRVDFNGVHGVLSDGSHDHSDPNHEYTYTWVANSDTLTMQVWDTHYHDNVGTLSYSVSVASVPEPDDTEKPSAPTNLRAEVVSASQINLTWNRSEDNVGVTGYKLYRDGEEFPETITNTSFQDTGLTENTTYQYVVKAVDAAGNVSDSSNEVTAKTNTTVLPVTKFKLTVVIHDIGIGCDNSSESTDTWCGTTTLAHPTRSVTVEVRESSAGPVVMSQTGQIDYVAANGNFVSHEDLDMGAGLTNKAYVVRVIAGPARLTSTISVTAGITNNINVTLTNGDANLDGRLSEEDYTTIRDCLDTGAPITNCDPVKAANANLDDSEDGVNLPDLNIFLREIKVQAL